MIDLFSWSFPKPKGLSILELGCGDGRWSRALAVSEGQGFVGERIAKQGQSKPSANVLGENFPALSRAGKRRCWLPNRRKMTVLSGDNYLDDVISAGVESDHSFHGGGALEEVALPSFLVFSEIIAATTLSIRSLRGIPAPFMCCASQQRRQHGCRLSGNGGWRSEVNLRYNGPTKVVFDTLPAEQQSSNRAGLEQYFAANNKATDGTVWFESEYLEVTAVLK